VNAQLPGSVRLTSVQNPELFLDAEVDSVGNYGAEVPTGKYKVTLPQPYFRRGDTIFSTGQKNAMMVTVRTGNSATVPTIKIPGVPVPDLLPEKGVLHQFNAAATRQVDQFITAYQNYYDIPGVSLALIKDGKLVYHKTYGVKNTFTREKVDDNTLFEAASITKPVFAFAVQRLAERGVIDLDKPLYEYLPNPDIAYDDRYKLITARHVLTHRTGFPNWREGKLTIKFTPGTDYGYSGEGFEYLKHVVQTITGKKVEQVLKEEVIEPMGLYHTFFSENDSLKKMVAYGHFDNLPSQNDLPKNPGMAYSMHTEAKIFTKFMLYLLEQKGLKPQTYDTMLSKHSEYKIDPGDEKPKVPTYMGMSLEVRETPYGKSFGHGGNNGDFQCLFEVYKDLKMGYAVFTNSNNGYFMLKELRELLVEGKEK
jgi:CubicO group peptidase (beta-lactamase class C family)